MSEEHVDHVGISTNGRRFSFGGGPAYILVIGVFIIGLLWVFGEYILPRTTRSTALDHLATDIQRENQTILRLVREIRSDALKEASFNKTLSELVRQSDRDMDVLLRSAREHRLLGEKILVILQQQYAPPPPPRHHSE